MKGFVMGGLRNRRSRALGLGAGIVVASVSFVLLTAAGKSSAIQLRGSVKSSYRAAYDIVVRPSGSRTTLEQREGLVRDNYLSGVYGGITLTQWHVIEHIPGVSVAAPIANVGYMNLRGNVPISLDRYLTKAPFQLFRVSYRFYANNDTWSYPSATEYVYFERPHKMNSNQGIINEIIPCRTGCAPLGFRAVEPCLAIDEANNQSAGTPFVVPVYQSCFAARSPGGGSDTVPWYPKGHVDSSDQLQFPIFLAGIDPTQEARLLGLDHAVVAGRYLREAERGWVVPCHCHLKDNLLHVPVIESTKTFLDERLSVRISRLEIPHGANVPERLSNGFAYQFVSGLRARPVARKWVTAQSIYRHLLPSPGQNFYTGAQLYWTTSPVHYRRARGVLHPQPVKNPLSTWTYFSGYWPSPIADSDTQYRRLHERNSRNSWDPSDHNIMRLPYPTVIGQYDPSRLPGFSPLSRVPLETYYPPLLKPADARSKRLLGSRPLLPNENVGDYIQQPPLVLTTIQGALPFLSSNFYTTNGNQDVARGQVDASKAPIAAIRVRVRGATGPDALSQARIDAVAGLIHDKTGLDVDITAGSSPHPLLVSLPKGKLGRPALLLTEGWSKKGVAVSFVKALNRKDLALFVLVLLIGAFFLANGAAAATKARRVEIGTLATLGWSRRAVFLAIVAELVVVGAIAGAIGVGLAALLSAVFALRASVLQSFLVLPTGVVLAVVAGIIPAWFAARGAPLDALRPEVLPTGRARTVRRLSTLALVNVARAPARIAVAAGGLVVGVAALTILIAIQDAFQGTLVGTLLGHALSVQVQSTDYVAVGLMIGLAMLSLADVLFLNLRERAAEFVTLISLGWRELHLAAVVATEAFVIGLIASVTGALLGLVAGIVFLGVPVTALLKAAALSAAGGVAAALVASLLPLNQLARLNAPRVLASE